MEAMGRLKVSSVFASISHYPKGIREACRVVSCLPTTQASVERLFSAKKLVLSDQRAVMKDDLLSAILFIRMNYQLK